MTDYDRLVNVLYEFILFELARCENDYRTSYNTYSSNKSQQNSYAVINSWIRYEYFRKIAVDIEELIRYCSI